MVEGMGWLFFTAEGVKAGEGHLETAKSKFLAGKRLFLASIVSHKEPLNYIYMIEKKVITQLETVNSMFLSCLG